ASPVSRDYRSQSQLPKLPSRAPPELTALPPVTGLNRTAPTAAVCVCVRARHEMYKMIENLLIRHVRGLILYTYLRMLKAIFDIHDHEDFPSNLIDGLPERLTAWIPSLVEHRCSIGERGGYLKRLHDGTWPGHILEHLSLELLDLAGVPAGFGRARETSRRGVYKVVIGSPPRLSARPPCAKRATS